MEKYWRWKFLGFGNFGNEIAEKSSGIEGFYDAVQPLILSILYLRKKYTRSKLQYNKLSWTLFSDRLFFIEKESLYWSTDSSAVVS